MIRISFKDPSVKANKIRPEIFHAIATAADVWENYGADEIIITSLNDGSHRQGSYHYTGDIRPSHLKRVVSFYEEPARRMLTS